MSSTVTVTKTISSTETITTVTTPADTTVVGGGTTGSGTTTGGGTTGSGGTTTGTQGILTMPTGITNGAPVTIGTGSDSIQLNLANNLVGNLPPNFPGCVVAVLLDSVPVAGPLTVSSNAGEDTANSQVFTLNGTWGPGPHTISIDGTGTGDIGLFINSVSYNLVPYQSGGNAGSFANGNNVTFSPATAAVVTTPPPVPALTTITGATINGAAATADTLQAIITATPAGGTLMLPGEAIVGVAGINAGMHIVGVTGKTIIDATNLPPYQGKGILVPSVPGVTISNVTLKGAAISAGEGANAAGVRDAGPGVGFTLTGSEITGCQDGLLTFASNITVSNSNIHDNGAGLVGGAPTHELYIGGGPATTFGLSSSTVSTGALATHAVKSRAGTTDITSCTLTAGAADGGVVSGGVVDIPDGGNATITGTTIALRPGAANTLFIGYGMESAGNLATGATLTLTDVVFDGGGVAGEIQNGTYVPTAVLVLSGCTYKGTAGAPAISGFASVTGTIAAA